MSDTGPRDGPREGTTLSPWAAPSLIAVIFINMLGFGIIVPLLPFYGDLGVKQMPDAFA